MLGMSQENKKAPIKEVAQLFFKLGVFAFGGPIAHMAMMEEEVVKKRKWFTTERFIDMVGATQLIPGPNSTEMTMHCGYERAGKWGMVVAGAAFIIPATIITGVLAWLYVLYGELPSVQPFIWGIKPAVLVVILHALVKWSKKAAKTNYLIALGIVALALCAFGFDEIAVLFGVSILGAIISSQSKGKLFTAAPLLVITSKGVWPVFFTFLKIGSILYGSGYVLFAYLDAELVQKGIMSADILLDAVAVGQITPGPVLSTATFIGYQLEGLWGSIAATVGIFLPSFILVLILHPFTKKIRQSKHLSHFMNAVNVVSLAIMAWVVLKMGYENLTDYKGIIIFGVVTLLTWFWKKWKTPYSIILGSVLGSAFYYLGM